MYYGGLWTGNFYPALCELGHEVIESQIDLLPTSRFMHIARRFTPQELEVRAQTTDQILDEVRTAHREQPVGLFLSYFYNSHFDPAGFDGLRSLGIPSVNFYCNSIYQFEFVRDIAANVDFAWHAERDARQSYLNVGANPVWVQMGADPRVYHPIHGVSPRHKACFVGQRYADRDRWIAALIGKRIPLDIYGPGWNSAMLTTATSNKSEYLGRTQYRPASAQSYFESFRETLSNCGAIAGLFRTARQLRYRMQTQRLTPLFAAHAKGSIPFERIAETFASYEVCLNFSNVWADGRPGSRLIPHVRLRDFEAPMCRTCYLTGETGEIREFYEVGKEIDTYATEDELVDKTRFYLGHADAAERLRKAGYQRARKDHTWSRRFEELFEKIGLSKAGKSSSSHHQAQHRERAEHNF